METKELKIQVPDGYEIDKENSTFECVKFKPIKKDITYGDVYKTIFSESLYNIDLYGRILYDELDDEPVTYRAFNEKQAKRMGALNQLLNIAEYYNGLHIYFDKCYTILYDNNNKKYMVIEVSPFYSFGIKPIFNRMEDVQAVIDNPNFEEILDMVYKDC